MENLPYIHGGEGAKIIIGNFCSIAKCDIYILVAIIELIG